MEWATSLKINATYVQMVMFVRLLDKATALCLLHLVQRVDGAVQELLQTLLPLFVMRDTNVQLAQLCKCHVPQADIIRASAPHNPLARFAN